MGVYVAHITYCMCVRNAMSVLCGDYGASFRGRYERTVTVTLRVTVLTLTSDITERVYGRYDMYERLRNRVSGCFETKRRGKRVIKKIQSLHMIPLQLLVFRGVCAVTASPPASRGCISTARMREGFLPSVAPRGEVFQVQKTRSGAPISLYSTPYGGTRRRFILTSPRRRPPDASAVSVVSVRWLRVRPTPQTRSDCLEHSLIMNPPGTPPQQGGEAGFHCDM